MKELNANNNKPRQLSIFERINKPRQLSLFERNSEMKMFHPYINSTSNIIGLYDLIPKYTYNKNISQSESIRRFKYNKNDYIVEITPAKIKGKEYFPGISEERIEDVLRKFVFDGHADMFNHNKDIQCGILFSYYQIQKELEKYKIKYNAQRIKHSLNILHRTHILIKTEEFEDGSTILPIFRHATKLEQAFISFHPLLTKAINESSFRYFDFEKTMICKNNIARYLIKRLFNNYKFADYFNSFDILMSTIVRDSHIFNNSPLRTRKSQILKSLNILIDLKIINSYETLVFYDQNKSNKIYDIKFSIKGTREFINRVKNYNSSLKNLRNSF